MKKGEKETENIMSKDLLSGGNTESLRDRKTNVARAESAERALQYEAGDQTLLAVLRNFMFFLRSREGI